MRQLLSLCLLGIVCVFKPIQFQSAFANESPSPQEPKEWTFLIFLNGNNNLDSFGEMNIKQMEKVGSTSNINVVVQWASLSQKKTQRLFVTKSSDSSKVTSPVVQDLGNVDMGDWHSVVDFVRWGAANYPAKHYFVNIWDHGSGWHALTTRGIPGTSRNFSPTDISWDDNTGHSITTAQLGQALNESAQVIGHKIDLYASDACLMAMAEVANEVVDSVDVFAGSQEVEPGTGWPYDTFLKRWAAKETNSAVEVGKYLTEEYISAYSGGQYGNGDGTFSTFDLSKMNVLNQAVSNLSKALQKLDANSRKKIVQLATQTQNFTFSDYGDLTDFMDQIEKGQVKGVPVDVTQEMKAAIKEFVVANGSTANYVRAQGLSIWLPTTASSYRSHAEKYATLRFNVDTRWGDALQALFQ